MRITKPNRVKYAAPVVALLVVSQLFGSFGLGGASAAPAPVHSSPVQVDANCGTVGTPVSCTTSKLDNANTTRKLGVSSDGTIFALFYGPEGIRVASSADRGANFAPAVQVSATNAEAELAVAANNNLYVVWSVGTSVFFSRSTDLGVTWSAPLTLTQTANNAKVHMAVDGGYVYLLNQRGTSLWISSDSGASFSASSINFGQYSTGGIQWAYADILVDPLTHKLYVFVDDPSVSWFVSSDFGATFSAENATGKSVYYSVSAISSSTAATYMYMAGSSTNLEKVDLQSQSGTVSTLTVNASSGANSMGRALAADGYGNVVATSVDSAGAISFQVSNDFGATFGAAQTLLATGTLTKANVSINQTNGDLMFVYQNGTDIYFQAYTGYLVGYDLALSLSSVSLGYAGEVKTVVLNNSGTTTLNFTSIALSNNVFTQTNTCTGALAVGASCSIQVTGSTDGAALLNISATNGAGSVSRTVPVTLGAITVTGATSTPVVICNAPAFTITERTAVSTKGQSITLAGEHLLGVSSVKIAGKAAVAKATSDTEIVIEVPAGEEGMPEFEVTGNCGQQFIQGLIQVYKPYEKVRTQKITLYHGNRPTLAGLREVENTYLKGTDTNLLQCKAILATDASAAEISLATKRINMMCNGVVKYARHIKAATITIEKDADAGSNTVMFVTFDRTLGGR